MTKKENTKLTDTSKQTPIEIALGIDEAGMTTASNLYAFLELDISHFSRWCKNNILNNKFATENEDYITFAMEGEQIKNNPNSKTDYKLTAQFAKQLSMTGSTVKHIEAQRYFIACEQGLKIATEKLKSSMNMQPLVDTIIQLTNNMSTMQQDIQELKQSQRNNQLPEKRYPSAWYKKIAPKYKMLMEYFNCDRNELYSEIYKELEDTYSVDINQIYEDYCYEKNLLKSECYRMEAIEHNYKLRDALTLLIDSNLVKYEIQTEDEIKNFKRKTIFDREPSFQKSNIQSITTNS